MNFSVPIAKANREWFIIVCKKWDTQIKFEIELRVDIIIDPDKDFNISKKLLQIKKRYLKSGLSQGGSGPVMWSG